MHSLPGYTADDAAIGMVRPGNLFSEGTEQLAITDGTVWVTSGVEWVSGVARR